MVANGASPIGADESPSRIRHSIPTITSSDAGGLEQRRVAREPGDRCRSGRGAAGARPGRGASEPLARASSLGGASRAQVQGSPSRSSTCAVERGTNALRLVDATSRDGRAPVVARDDPLPALDRVRLGPSLAACGEGLVATDRVRAGHERHRDPRRLRHADVDRGGVELSSGPAARRPSPVQVVAALWGAAIVAALVVGAVGPARWGVAIAEDGPGCPFHALTGVDCPFCGMIRATLALGRGDWRAALALHPLAPLVLAGVLVLLAIVALGRADVLLRGRRPLALLGAILAVWVVRLAVG
jgi:hypothetical protein